MTREETAHVVRPAPSYRARLPKIDVALLPRGGFIDQAIGTRRLDVPAYPSSEGEQLRRPKPFFCPRTTAMMGMFDGQVFSADLPTSFGPHGPAFLAHAEMQDDHLEDLDAHLDDFAYLTPQWRGE